MEHCSFLHETDFHPWQGSLDNFKENKTYEHETLPRGQLARFGIHSHGMRTGSDDTLDSSHPAPRSTC